MGTKAANYSALAGDRRTELAAIVARTRILGTDWDSTDCAKQTIGRNAASTVAEVWLEHAPKRHLAPAGVRREFVFKTRNYSYICPTKGLDAGPVVLSEFSYQDRVLQFSRPRSVAPHRDSTGELLLVEIPDLGIEVFGSTHDELHTAIHDELDFLWRRIALQPDSSLSAKARELKARLREEIMESMPIS